MVDIGHKLVSELHGPTDLVEYAQLTEDSAFEFANVSDHFHPWLPEQGESPLVWNVLGAIAQATDDLEVWTGVTCPTTRIHPAIIAQAAATTATMFEGRFTFGVGTGENLSEHVLGDRWPEHRVRLEMLEEAIWLMRALWSGDNVSHDGEYYTVENARLFTLPEEPPDVAVAADGPKTARKAGEIGDGLITVVPDERLVETFAETADDDGIVYGEATVCWAEDEDEAIDTVAELWPQEALPSTLLWDLPTPAHFAEATEAVSRDDVAEAVPCGPDPDAHVEAIQAYVDAGFDAIAVHQVGSDQEGFLECYEEEVLPAFD
ncbi:TIGR03557 family F420-dependent LLM class oxidoreductase [Natrialbaceae archaeon AArc-T1-2]|uniref:TIGR03557 family F420-dependent LLM class oxidoreductase n=1 Tax=Natrialbaceae archaeon AArc-T1-2 TaxID=3053904 RepID=UPI00255A7E05|nr:TIGR03557 family F420-dependent LLM class oxidoreductase [Natrialbaceae archaeon AArc-T1-2]WIV68675.1 TIGR03557 family F420-dependent LLM class oxidoreductase [Natrialbaceae archaeon AArc-T1-2]